MKAGRQCGDLVHPLVYCPELHFSEFTSAVADMKNSVAVGVEQGGLRSPVRPQIWALSRGGEKNGEGMALSLVSPQHVHSAGSGACCLLWSPHWVYRWLPLLPPG